MRRFAALLTVLAAPAAAQVPAPQAQPQPQWNPAASYVTIGQDEPGYRNWYSASPRNSIAVTHFNNYLTTWGVGGIVPTWQLLRTASSWSRCGAQPFEVPPMSEWPHIVQTLRYIHDYVIPAVGPVEPVSAYRNPILNSCAGGAPESAHKHYSAVDLVPLTPTTRSRLMRDLCAVHARRGTAYGVGLGFYAYLRFHVDTTKFRRWGSDPSVASCPPLARPADIASTAQPQPGTTASIKSPPVTAPPSTQPPSTPAPAVQGTPPPPAAQVLPAPAPVPDPAPAQPSTRG